MSPLTYSRLVTRLQSLLIAIDDEIPSGPRHTSVKRVLSSGLTLAMCGTKPRHKFASAGRLKRLIRARIAVVHAHYDAERPGKPDMDVEDTVEGDGGGVSFVGRAMRPAKPSTMNLRAPAGIKKHRKNAVRSRSPRAPVAHKTDVEVARALLALAGVEAVEVLRDEVARYEPVRGRSFWEVL